MAPGREDFKLTATEYKEENSDRVKFKKTKISRHGSVRSEPQNCSSAPLSLAGTVFPLRGANARPLALYFSITKFSTSPTTLLNAFLFFPSSISSVLNPTFHQVHAPVLSNSHAFWTFSLLLFSQ